MIKIEFYIFSFEKTILIAVLKKMKLEATSRSKTSKLFTILVHRISGLTMSLPLMTFSDIFGIQCSNAWDLY